MRRLKNQMALALALVAVPFGVCAQHSYTYVEGGYAELEHDGPPPLVMTQGSQTFHDFEADGFFLGGSAEVGGSFHVFGAYRKGSDDVSTTVRIRYVAEPVTQEVDGDITQFNIGVGYHTSVSDGTDVLAEIAFYDTDIRARSYRDSRLDGVDGRMSVGVRHLLGERLEIWGKASYTDGDVYDGTASGTVGLQYKLTQTWGLVGEFEGGSGYSQFGMGVRASF